MNQYLIGHTHLGNPRFWHNYAHLSPDLGLIVAKAFPHFWRQQYADNAYSKFFAYDPVAAGWDALSWAYSNRARLESMGKKMSAVKPVVIELKPFLDRINSNSDDSHLVNGDYVEELCKALDNWIARFNAQQRRWVDAKDWSLVTKVPASSWLPCAENGASIISGDPLVNQNSLTQMYGIRGDAKLNHLRWGALLLPYEEARKAHFCVVGMPRSGKTVLIRLLIESLGTHRKSEKRRVRFVTYDRKGELYPILQGVPPNPAHADRPTGTFLLNPFDKRGVAWDIAADANSLHFAREVAKILIPSTGHEKPYFVNAPRELLAAAIMSLREVRGKLWTLMDLLIACKPSNIQAVLSKSSTGRDAIESYLRSPHGSSADILSTLATYLAPFQPIAAAWDKTSAMLSIRDWAATSKISLVLADSEKHSLAMRTLNQVLIQLVSECLLDSQIEKPRDTFLILDELQNIGRIPALPTLLSTGASLGVTVVLGLHDLTALNNVYGEDTEGLLGMCGHFAFLRVNARETATWASDQFGQLGLRSYRTTETTTPGLKENEPSREGKSVSVFEETKPVVPADDIRSLPLASIQSGLQGFFKSYIHPPYRSMLSGKILFTDEDPTDDETISLFHRMQLKKKPELIPVNLATLHLHEKMLATFIPRPESDLVPREHFLPLEVNSEISGRAPHKENVVNGDYPRDIFMDVTEKYHLSIPIARWHTSYQYMKKIGPKSCDLVAFPQTFYPRFCRFAVVPNDANSLPNTMSPSHAVEGTPVEESPAPKQEVHNENPFDDPAGEDVREAEATPQAREEQSSTNAPSPKNVAADLFNIKRPKR